MSDQPALTSAVPILRYEHLAESLAFLATAFGLERTFVAEEHGTIVHAQMRAGSSRIFLSPDTPGDRYGMRSPLHLDGTSQCVYVIVAGDLDAHADRARAGGAEIITDPYDTDYGGREYTCRDPEGHVWSFGTYGGEPL